jgi:hypothetical protein
MSMARALLPGLVPVESVARRVEPIMARAGRSARGYPRVGGRSVVGQPRARAVASASEAALGSIADTSPPNVAISLTRLELT